MEDYATPPRTGGAQCRYCNTRSDLQWILLESYPHRHYESICPACLTELDARFRGCCAISLANLIICLQWCGVTTLPAHKQPQAVRHG